MTPESPRHRRFHESSESLAEGPKIDAGIGLPKYTLPWIREASFGATLGARAASLEAQPAHRAGPADLVHWGRHYGEKSSRFLHNPFQAPGQKMTAKDEEGYVGFYHFCNGLDYSRGAAALEEYVYSAVGVEKAHNAKNGDHLRWQPGVDLHAYGAHHHREMVVTLCTYNVFARSELRARYVFSVGNTRQSPISAAASYTVTETPLKRTHAFGSHDIALLAAAFWHELAVLTLVRAFLATDDPALRVCGTVSLPLQIETAAVLWPAIERTVALLPRGHMTGAAARWGVVSGGENGPATAKYRNLLVDALVRLVLLDMGCGAATVAVEAIGAQFGSEYDYVVCRLLRADLLQNNDQRFLELVAENHKRRPQLCQTALLLVEQTRFLVARLLFALAVDVATRAVQILPQDYDAWYNLALCLALAQQYDRALLAVNSFPVSMSSGAEFLHPSDIHGTRDDFARVYGARAAANKPLDLRTFELFFPPPTADSAEVALMESIWHKGYMYLPHLRHPICGAFFRSPVTLATTVERLAVDARLLRQAGPDSAKYVMAAASLGTLVLLVLDFDSKSTWGRTYDLLTLMVAMMGWDEMVHVRNTIFRAADTGESGDFVVGSSRGPPTECKSWLQVLLLTIYDDLRVMGQLSLEPQHRSALAWEMLGFLGWLCKYNLKDSVLSLFTSVSGVSSTGGFDYFGTVKVLEIFNEFVLSDVAVSTIDPLSDVYDGRHFTNKLILQNLLPAKYRDFVRQISSGLFSLENILLCVTKLVSYNLRWYNYMPSFLATNTLIKLCAKYDLLHIRSLLHMMYKAHEKPPAKKTPSFTLKEMFAAPQDEDVAQYEFVENDTIMGYMERMLVWIELLPKYR